MACVPAKVLSYHRGLEFFHLGRPEHLRENIARSARKFRVVVNRWCVVLPDGHLRFARTEKLPAGVGRQLTDAIDQLVSNRIGVRTDRQLQTGTVRYHIVFRAGTERSDGHNRRIKRVDAPAHQRLKAHDIRGRGNDRIDRLMGARAVSAAAVNHDIDRVDIRERPAGHDPDLTCRQVAIDVQRDTEVRPRNPVEKSIVHHQTGAGARLMMDDGLFDRVPRPDFSIALHVDGDLPAGQVGIVPGWAFANVDSVDVVIYGRGGHGARPHQTVDPIVAAASYVMSLQTLVSRRINPLDPAVVTVGSFRAGAKHNVIPDSARLQLTVRSYSDTVRDQLIDGIGQLAADTCRQFLCPREPEVTVREHHTPSVYNDPELSRRARDVFAQVLGPSEVKELQPAMVGEDFGRYARHLGIPGLLYRLGSVEAEVYQRSREPGGPPLPSLHSARYRPDPRPTLRTGFRSMAALALDLLGAGRADSNVLQGSGGRAE